MTRNIERLIKQDERSVRELGRAARPDLSDVSARSWVYGLSSGVHWARPVNLARLALVLGVDPSVFFLPPAGHGLVWD